ncbi:MAG: iron ABC transporter permease [Desulfobacteraceae bacterium]|nr:MAG: iron ABC transporter permease [Desulfobacteraceae bacterium]
MESGLLKRLALVLIFLTLLLAGAVYLGISTGSAGSNISDSMRFLFMDKSLDPVKEAIIRDIRFPRVILAGLIGAALSLGGLVFQALLRNPLAEPYILGISGGSAIGAIFGIIMGFSYFPGVSIMAFTGSLATLALLLVMSSGGTLLKRDSLLLSGVMVNAFCSAVIMFLVSMTRDAHLHNIIFWLMGDLSTADMGMVMILAAVLLPCFLLLFWLSNIMNLLLMGQDMAQTMGVNIKAVSVILLVTTSFMVSATVSVCGLIGFVGLVIPHLLRIILGSDHRILVPASVLGGGAYMVICDMLARILPSHGEMPAGVITALIGAPLFIYLLKRSRV